MKRYPVEMGFIVEPTGEDGFTRIVTEIDGEDVVLASDYDALLADAKRLYEALENAIELTDPSLTDSEREWMIDQGLDTAGGFRERWLQEGL